VLPDEFGPNDVVARLFAQRMGEVLGQPIIVKNIGGAGGTNGADRVAKAAPDGYTFLHGTVGTQAQNQTLFKKPAYISTTDFAPVALILEAPLVLIARKDVPVKDMKEFVAYAKAKGQHAIRFRGHRFGNPSGLRAGQSGDRARRGPCPVSRRQPGDAGP
jgi:tripartite-type tricarboxylate transporter receptor subunit TctC